jgi:hypothetical protein
MFVVMHSLGGMPLLPELLLDETMPELLLEEPELLPEDEPELLPLEELEPEPLLEALEPELLEVLELLLELAPELLLPPELLPPSVDVPPSLSIVIPVSASAQADATSARKPSATSPRTVCFSRVRATTSAGETKALGNRGWQVACSSRVFNVMAQG